MTYKCSECGEAHDEVPRFFMLKRPQREDGSLIDATHDYQSMCRTRDQSFVHCEIEVPLIGAPETPMGFICWVEVTAEDYRRLLVFRTHEGSVALLDDRVGGTLANRIPGVSDSFGTPVKFKVLAGDPTPYVRWIEPGTTLADFVEAGAPQALLHGLASRR
jgi:hypothetical protein